MSTDRAELQMEIVKHFESSSNAVISALETIRSKRMEFSSATNKYIVELFNSTQHALMYQLDFGTLIKNFSICKFPWEIKLISRTSSLLIIDFYDNKGNIYGKKFREAISVVPKGSEYLVRWNELHKEITSIIKTNEKFLREIRNYSFGHSYVNANIKHRMIVDLNENKIKQLTLQIFKWISRFSDLMSDLFLSLS